MTSLLVVVTAVIFTFMSCLFILSVIIKRNDIADVAWGIGIIIVGIIGYLSDYVPADVGNSGLSGLLLTLYLLWGLRLFWRIGKRNFRKKEEDPRYKIWRDQWGKWFYIRSYFQVYMLQGLLMIVVGSPLLVASSMFSYSNLVYFGLLIWIIGYFFEVIGDYQLDRFLKSKKEPGSIMNTGLWKYTRHPNYFGEVTMWWGIFLMVTTLPYGIIAIMSPLVTTFLILKVSGIPMLEKAFDDNPAFQEYKRTTSAFFPLPTKKSD